MENFNKSADFELSDPFDSLDQRVSFSLRWALTTSEVSVDDQAKNYLFIGMNPSSAKKFACKSDGGDTTTEEILKCFDDKLFTPQESNFLGKYKRITLLNLIPLISTKCSAASTLWSLMSEENKDQITKKTVTLIREHAQKSDYIIPMWGEDEGWKKDMAREIVPELLALKNSADKIFAFYKPTKPFPRHCGYRNWKGEKVIFGNFHKELSAYLPMTDSS